MKYVETALNGREYEEVEDEPGWYESDDGLLRFKLEGDVEGLLDEEFDFEWEIPQPDLNQLLIASGQETIKTEVEKEAEAKPNRVSKPRRPAGAAPVSRDGLTTLAEICEELKIEPRDARKILRDKVQKPDAGWAWPADEVKKIKALLK